MQEAFGDGPASGAGAKQRYAALKELGDCHAAVGDTETARRCYREACDLAPEETGAYVGLGALAVQDNRLEQARRSFEIARHLDPQCADAFSGLAAVYHQNKDHAAAFEMYLRCLELDGDNLMALLGLFQTSCQMGTFAKIIYYLEVYLANHHDDTAVMFCLATLYARDGELARAGGALRRVLELEPDKTEAAKLLAEVTCGIARNRPSEMAAI